MSAERFNGLKVTGITVFSNVANIWQLSFDGVSSASFLLSDHTFHLHMRRYELSIAIYLRRDDAIPIVMPLLCKLSMIDHVGQEKVIGDREVVVEKGKELVLLESVMITDLERQKAEFLAQDTLTISCSLSSSYRLNLLKQNEPRTDQIINHCETLSSDLERFYKSQKYTDALLKAENTEFPIHQTILYARSPELASMLNTESPNKALDISNFPASVLKEVLYYIYTGKIRALTSGSVAQMAAAANKFSLDELKEVCLKFLRSTLTEDNVFDAALLAYKNGDLLLKEEVEKYLVEHVVTILQTEKWKEFCSEKYKFANELLTAVLLRMQSTSSRKEDC